MKKTGVEEEFYRDIEARLKENRKLMEESYLPKFVANATSYLGFHSFSSVLFLSLLITVVMYEISHEWLMRVSKLIFWLP